MPTKGQANPPYMQQVLLKNTAYLKRNEKTKTVKVFDSTTTLSKTINTGYKVLCYKNGVSLVEVNLITGRTHQIRAHFSSIGHPLLGDGKYGTNALNKSLGYKKQFLYSYRLVFSFSTDAGILNYLNGKDFSVQDVWFKTEFLNGKLTNPS